MNYFSLTSSDDGSDLDYYGDPMDIIRNLGQVVADNEAVAHVLMGIVLHSKYCNNEIIENTYDELINIIDDKLSVDLDEMTELFFDDTL